MRRPMDKPLIASCSTLTNALSEVDAWIETICPLRTPFPSAHSFVPGTTMHNGVYVPFIAVTLSSSDQYFGGRRLAAMDQLGSVGTYYPWGEVKGSTNPQDIWSYATYWRDSFSGLDYANNRYYSNIGGRFMTPDPYTNSGRPERPSKLEPLRVHARRSRESS